MLKKTVTENRWMAAIIISLLVSALTFFGGRYSVLESISANETVNQLQDQRINRIDDVMRLQGIKLDHIYEVVIRLDQKLSD